MLFSASFYGLDVKVTDHFSCLELRNLRLLFFPVQLSVERPHDSICGGDGDFQRGHYFLDDGRGGG